MNREEVQIIQKNIATDTPKNKAKLEIPKAPKKSTRKKASIAPYKSYEGGARKKEGGGRKKNGNARKVGETLASDQGVLVQDGDCKGKEGDVQGKGIAGQEDDILKQNK